MKKVSKRIFICVVLIAVVFAIFTAINVNAFYKNRVDSIVIGDGDLYQSKYPEAVDSRKATYTSDLKHALLSNVYIHEYVTDSGPCMQIRFRVTYAFPFMHRDMFGETTLALTNESGKELGAYMGGMSDTVSGFYGCEFFLRFAGDDIPQPGEKLYFSFTSTEDGATEPYASGKIEIEI